MKTTFVLSNNDVSIFINMLAFTSHKFVYAILKKNDQ